MRDALEVIDAEIDAIRDEVRRDVADRLAAGGRVVATREGVTTLTYIGDDGVPVIVPVRSIDDLVPLHGPGQARAA